MFLIYSLEPETLNITPYEIHTHHKDAAEALKNIAIEFIRSECGDKRAESPFKDNIKDSDIKEDGYFLRRSDQTTDRIDVFLRKTKITPGWLSTGVDTKIKIEKFYAIKEAALNLPIEKPTELLKKPKFETEKQSHIYNAMISELKDKLKSRNANIFPVCKLDCDIDTDSDTDSDMPPLACESFVAPSIPPLIFPSIPRPLTPPPLPLYCISPLPQFHFKSYENPLKQVVSQISIQHKQTSIENYYSSSSESSSEEEIEKSDSESSYSQDNEENETEKDEDDKTSSTDSSDSSEDSQFQGYTYGYSSREGEETESESETSSEEYGSYENMPMLSELSESSESTETSEPEDNDFTLV